jgi:salicylate hydroxylase
MTGTAEVVVIGGGLGGMAAALGLARAGHAPVVLEASVDPPPDRFGLNLWPSGWRVLEALGVLDDVQPAARPLHRVVFESGSDESGAFATGTGRHYLGVLPSVLQRALERHARSAGVVVERGWRLVALERSSAAVSALLARGADRRRIGARLLLGCDGPQSPTRALIGVPSAPLRFPGQAVHTTIGGRVSADEVRYVFGRGWALTASPVGPSESWMAMTSHDGVGPAALRGHGPEEVRAVVAGAAGWTRVVPASARVPRWEADRVVLLGEAAHPMLPHLGLGGTHTLEDVPVLLETLQPLLRDDRLDREALARFRAARSARVDHARRVSNWWAAFVAAPFIPTRLLRDGLCRWMGRHPAALEGLLAELGGAGLATTMPRLRSPLVPGGGRA